MRSIYKKVWKIIGPAICMLILYGCILGNGSNDSNNTSKQLVSLKVTASSAALIPIGGTLQLKATAVYSDNSTDDVTNFSVWSSSNTSVATVDITGLVHSVGESGTSIITAQYNDGTKSVKNNIQVTVSNAAITSIVIEPSSVNIPVGFYQRVTLTGNLEDGSTVDLSVDPDATWQTSTPQYTKIIESVVPQYPQGAVAVYGKSSGDSVITANYKNSKGNILSSNANATVNNATLESIAIQGPQLLSPSESVTYAAIGYFTDGSSYVLNNLNGTNFSSSSPLVVSIDAHSGFATSGDKTYLDESSILTLTYKANSTESKLSISMSVTVGYLKYWSSEIKTNFSASEYVIGVDSHDNPILSYIDKNESVVMATIYRNGNWYSLDNPAESSTGIVSPGNKATSLAMTVDHSYQDYTYTTNYESDVVYVDYTTTQNGYVTVKKLYLESQAPNWITMQAGINNGDNGFNMSYNSIAIDSNHYPYIAFHEHKDGKQTKLSVLKWGDSSFSHYGKSNYAQDEGHAAHDLGLAITETTGKNSVYLGYLQDSTVRFVYNDDGGKWQGSYSLPASTPKFNSVAGLYNESIPFAAFEEIMSGYDQYENPTYTGFISLADATYGKGKLAIRLLNSTTTPVENAQPNITLSEQYTDKPVITYVDNYGYIQVIYYSTKWPFPNTGMQDLGVSPAAAPSDPHTTYSNPKVAVGANIAWLAYQNESGQIILKKLDTPFD